MNDNRRQILNMLADRKITAEEAERLLAALESGSQPNSGQFAASAQAANPFAPETPRGKAQYLRVQVVADEKSEGNKGPTTVNIRVPMQLLRAGVRLASLIPVQAHQHLDEAFRKHGLPMTLSQIKPENLEELVDHLSDLTVDVDSGRSKSDVKVRVFSE